jgi:hypothetical protein
MHSRPKAGSRSAVLAFANACGLGKLELRSRHQVTEWASRTDLAG